MRSRQMSDSYLLGILLALTGGYLDAHTYLFRGGVFANAQTGNIVLFGISLAKGDFLPLVRYLIPILAFVAGVIVAEGVRLLFLKNPAIHWRQIVIAMEILILLGAAWLPQGEWDNVVNVSISFVCALQVETFRKIHGNSLATTMCTGNLRSATELLFHGIRTRDRSAISRCGQYLGIILSFILGAAAGVCGTDLWGGRALLACCALLLAVFFAMFFRRRAVGPDNV